jgi:predicted metal-dependent hydrolase
MVRQLQLGDISVSVEFKDIKNVHLSVHPPTGRVTISAPSRMNLDTIRVYAVSRLAWIRQQQKKLRAQERETPRDYVDRESHYVWGKRYLLTVIEENAPPSVELKHSRMILRVRPGTDFLRRQAIVDGWYRSRLKEAAAPLIAKWEPRLGTEVARFFVQKMKTKWGSCNAASRTIRLNSELAKKPAECLEYIVVHEMAHLLVRRHDDRFIALMDTHLPSWRMIRQTLNSSPLAHSEWDY